LDDLIVFRHLTKEDLKDVIDIELSKVRKRLAERGLKLVLTDAAKEFVIRKGSNLDLGARPLRREIEQRVEDPLSEELLKGEFQGKDTITVDVKKDDEGKAKHLVFVGTVGEGELVGAGAPAASPESSGGSSEAEPAGKGP
jgi:ATP-dependent Clp protease ATP-binding subunit ClpC